jgi:cell shape-determining protein MreC
MTSKFDFLDDEPQVTNSNETALHINRELAKMRFEQIIKLGNENHEQRGQMALLREEIKELYKENVELRKMLDKAFDAGFEFDEEE